MQVSEYMIKNFSLSERDRYRGGRGSLVETVSDSQAHFPRKPGFNPPGSLGGNSVTRSVSRAAGKDRQIRTVRDAVERPMQRDAESQVGANELSDVHDLLGGKCSHYCCSRCGWTIV